MNKLIIIIAVLIAFCCFKDKITGMIPGSSKFINTNSFGGMMGGGKKEGGGY
jgi:hypothetical protein